MKNSTTLLNPFSVSLKQKPFMEVRTKPVYTNGDFRIYKYFDRWYLHTFKNIVIAERCGANKEMIESLITGTKPTDEGALYHQYQRPMEAMQDGIEAAKALNFQVK